MIDGETASPVGAQFIAPYAAYDADTVVAMNRAPTVGEKMVQVYKAHDHENLTPTRRTR